MAKTNKSIILLAVIIMLAPSVSANTVSFQDKYQDYRGEWHVFDNNNISSFPLYTITETQTDFIVSRFDETFKLNKSESGYDFQTIKIMPSIKNVVPGSTLRFTIDPVFLENGNELKSKHFTRTLSATVTYSNGLSSVISGRIIEGKIEYLIPLNVVDFKENTITVNNATTAGWTTSNISLNGSRLTDNGLIAIHLRNDSSHNMTNLTAYWSLDETEGTTIHNVNNESGLFNYTNQSGTWNGNTTLNYTTGKIGNASIFDGINDYVDVGYENYTNSSQNLTVSFWVNYIDSGTAAFNGIISNQNIATSSTGYGLYIFNNTQPNANKVLFSVGSVSFGTNTVTSTNKVSNTTFSHVVVTYNSTKECIYINGTFDKCEATTSELNLSTQTLKIGKLSAEKAFNGTLDEVLLYNRVLNASEISVLYNTSFRTQAMPLIFNQTASPGYNINRTRVFFSGRDSINNISIYARQNGTSNWDLIKSDAISGTWYSITNQFNVMDFGLLMQGNGSNTTFLTSLEWDETQATFSLSGYVNNTLGAPIDGAKVNVNGLTTYTQTMPLPNNTNLAPSSPGHPPGTSERVSGTTYFTNSSSIELFVFAHASSVADTAEIHLYINGVKVGDTSGRPIGGAESSNKTIIAIIPRYSSYMLEFTNAHHYEWREYPYVSGYYKFRNLNAGTTYNINASAIGYLNSTNVSTINADTEVNFVLEENTHEDIHDLLLAFIILVLAIVVVFFKKRGKHH